MFPKVARPLLLLLLLFSIIIPKLYCSLNKINLSLNVYVVRISFVVELSYNRLNDTLHGMIS